MTIHELVLETKKIREDIVETHAAFENRDIEVSHYAARIARLAQRYQANLDTLAANHRDEFGRKV